MRPFDLIAFDGDDTLWHNERSYKTAKEHFRRLLADTGVVLTEEQTEALVNSTEVQNVRYYGYGVSSFVLSLIETAIQATGGRIRSTDLRELIDLAKRMLTEDVELFEGAREAVETLAPRYPLIVITKGDLLHQTSKADRSGLRDRFRAIEVVSVKTPPVYAAILDRHHVDPARFLMVGNSIRSDVVPVLELGGWAAHVPAELSWSHEDGEVPGSARHRYFELASLHALPALVESLARTNR
jgi:putative hydrolase of the HAD superfamily